MELFIGWYKAVGKNWCHPQDCSDSALNLWLKVDLRSLLRYSFAKKSTMDLWCSLRSWKSFFSSHMLLWHSPHAIQPIDTVQILHLFQRCKLVRTPKSFLRKTGNLLKRPTKGTNKEVILAANITLNVLLFSFSNTIKKTKNSERVAWISNLTNVFKSSKLQLVMIYDNP